ncbi:hypothetical protein BH09SUM1_BH09SUM1_23270 [soil metagenome]
MRSNLNALKQALVLAASLATAPVFAQPPAVSAAMSASPAAAVALKSGFAAFPGAVAPDTITKDSVDKEVAIAGKVIKVQASTGERVPTRLTLFEAEGRSVMVVFWPDMAPKILGAATEVPVGAMVTAKGKLSAYKDALQIQIKSADQIRIDGASAGAAMAAPAMAAVSAAVSAPVAGAAAAVKPEADGYYPLDALPALKVAKMNKKISMKGEIKSFSAARTDRAPNTVKLESNGQSVDVVYWNQVGVEPKAFSEVGKPLYVTGTLGMYKEKLQLSVKSMEDISMTPLAADRIASTADETGGPSAKPAKEGWPGALPVKGAEPTTMEAPAPGQPIKINAIKRSYVGQKITVQGKVDAANAKDNGQTLLVTDGTASIYVVLGPEIEQKPVKGDSVRLTGELSYNAAREQPQLTVNDQAAIEKGE